MLPFTPMHEEEGEFSAVYSELERLEAKRSKVEAALKRLDPTGELLPIWRMLQHPAASPHGYWDLKAMEDAVYKQHGERMGTAVESDASSSMEKAERRSHGLMLDGRHEELTLIPLHKAGADVYQPVSRQQIAQRKVREVEVLREELATLEGRREKARQALQRLDPTGELLPIWRNMVVPVNTPGGWYGLLELENNVYASFPANLSPRSGLTPAQWRETRRDNGLLIAGQLDQLDTEIAQLQQDLSQHSPASHSSSSAAGRAAEERSLSLGRRRTLGLRAAKRHRGEEYRCVWE